MNLNLQKMRSSFSLKVNKKSNKLQQICSSCAALKRQVRQLKQLQQKIVKEIKLIIAFVPKEIETLAYKIKTRLPYSQQEPSPAKNKSITPLNLKPTPVKNSPEQKVSYESKLKEEDSVIKESIYKELKAIRALETKQKDLRIANEKHQIIRKSMSKETLALNNTNKSKTSKPNSARSIQYASPQAPSSPIDKQMWRQELHTDNWISSPKFGKTHEDLKQQSNSKYSSQDSRNKPRKFSQSKPEYQILKCANGHEFYKGETVSKIPHGIGTLMNCCGKIPIKVAAKTLKYTGSFMYGQFQGKGILICKDSVKFQGNFSKGMRHGQGIIYLDGSGQRGVWDQDKLVSFI